jgi:hypothetical protein
MGINVCSRAAGDTNDNLGTNEKQGGFSSCTSCGLSLKKEQGKL